jgi:hypothetical protein
LTVRWDKGHFRDGGRFPAAPWLAVVVGLLLLPTGTAAASSASFDDPIGDTTEYAPDLGATTMTVSGQTIAVNTRIVPRPPAYWGGCAYTVGYPPYQTCVPSNMNVTWYIDHTKGSGSVADGGADAKVVVVPARGQTFWESDRWDSANGRFTSGAQPAASEDSGGVSWTLNLSDLGIPRPSTVRVWVVSLYKSYNGLGALLNYSDTAGPGAVSVGGGASRACLKATDRVNRLQRRLRKAKRHSAGRGALARLRAKRNRGIKTMKQRCHSRIVSGAPPKKAPPGCHLVTKPVLKQEGVGIHAEWVVKPEVVVECSK